MNSSVELTERYVRFSLILQRKDYSRGSKRQVAYLLMEERISQIKKENCFASLLSVIHTKYNDNGRRCGRQDLIFKTEYFLGRQKENTPFKRWK